jgi:hypothetical protein
VAVVVANIAQQLQVVLVVAVQEANAQQLLTVQMEQLIAVAAVAVVVLYLACGHQVQAVQVLLF